MWLMVVWLIGSLGLVHCDWSHLGRMFYLGCIMNCTILHEGVIMLFKKYTNNQLKHNLGLEMFSCIIFMHFGHDINTARSHVPFPILEVRTIQHDPKI